jgi:PAS domain S-box-containing protein
MTDSPALDPPPWVAAVASTESAALSKTLDGTIVGWNSAAEQLYGYSAAEVVGRPVTVLMPRDRAGEFDELLERVAAGEHVVEFATRRVRKDGVEIDVVLALNPVRAPDGAIIGATTLVRTPDAPRFAAQRNGPRQDEELDVSELVRGLEPLLRKLLGAQAELRLRLARDLPRIAGDRTSLEAVMTNLLLNARDALPNGGAVTIETRSTASAVVVDVTDDGAGMDDETLAHAFEPFFTTKPPGAGSGLGLATVRAVVEQHGGEVSLATAPGAGTSVRVAFAVADAARRRAEAATAPGGNEAVLVVEDDDSLLALTATVLRRQGYDVTPARDAEHALRAAAARDLPFDLLVTDVVMPAMSGPELARTLGAMGGPIPTLYMSGYTRDATIRHGLVAPADSFLVKPFTPRLLLERARATLDRQAKAGHAA